MITNTIREREMSRTYLKMGNSRKGRHPREDGGPLKALETWIPACAGMTKKDPIGEEAILREVLVVVIKNGEGFYETIA